MAILDTEYGLFVGSAQFCDAMYTKAKQNAEEAKDKAARTAAAERLIKQFPNLTMDLAMLPSGLVQNGSSTFPAAFNSFIILIFCGQWPIHLPHPIHCDA